MLSPSGLTISLGRIATQADAVVVDVPCTAVSHAETVNRAWHTLIPHADASGLAWGTCRLCHSTLCKQLPVKRWWANRRDNVIRVEHSDGHQSVYSLDGYRIVDFDDEEFSRAVADQWTDERRCQGWDLNLDAALAATDEAYERTHGEAA